MAGLSFQVQIYSFTKGQQLYGSIWHLDSKKKKQILSPYVCSFCLLSWFTSPGIWLTDTASKVSSLKVVVIRFEKQWFYTHSYRHDEHVQLLSWQMPRRFSLEGKPHKVIAERAGCWKCCVKTLSWKDGLKGKTVVRERFASNRSDCSLERIVK